LKIDATKPHIIHKPILCFIALYSYTIFCISPQSIKEPKLIHQISDGSQTLEVAVLPVHSNPTKG